MPFGQPAHAQEELPSAQFAHPDSRLRSPHLIPGLGIGAADGECHPFVELAPGGESVAGITSTPAAPTVARWLSTTRDQVLEPAAAEHIKISIPVEEDAQLDSLATGQSVVSQLTSISTLLLQGTADEDLGIPLLHLIRTLGTISLLTMVFAISTALYQPAAGALFGRIKILYYVTLGAIFLSGVAEAITVVWLSRGRDDIGRRFIFGRVVLCASVVPFVAILGIGGSRFIKG